MWWRNAKFWIILIITLLLFAAFLMMYVCGGPTLNRCFSGSKNVVHKDTQTPNQPHKPDALNLPAQHDSLTRTNMFNHTVSSALQEP